jgi:hypothetical protein
MYAFLISLMRVMSFTQLNLLELIILAMFDEEYKLWSTSLGYNFLLPPVTSCLSWVQLFSEPCSQTLSV